MKTIRKLEKYQIQSIVKGVFSLTPKTYLNISQSETVVKSAIKAIRIIPATMLRTLYFNSGRSVY
jgi:hypothetical protein